MKWERRYHRRKPLISGISGLEALVCICSTIPGTTSVDGWQEMQWILEVRLKGPA